MSHNTKPRESLVGKRFNRLLVLSADVKAKRKSYFCKCDCGKITTVRDDSLRSGKTQSCGCLYTERRMEVIVRHGEYKKRLYSIWSNIKQRCNNPKNTGYKYYGAKGIGICDQWLQYENFRDWALANGYSYNLTIDRIDSLAQYCPENCRWITQEENTRRAHLGEKRDRNHKIIRSATCKI